MGDRPSGKGFQEHLPNHFYDMPEVTRVYEAIGEKADKISQVGIVKMSESEPTDEVTKRSVVVKSQSISRGWGRV